MSGPKIGGLLENGGGEECSDAMQKFIVEGFGSVGWKVVVWIAELCGIRPHQGRNTLVPEGDMVAAGQDGKDAFGAGDYLESSDRQVGSGGAALLKDKVHGAGRLFIGKQA